MGERRGTKALELWCRRITDGYPGVQVENMTTSWRDGLAFCAMIHHFRPDLIDFTKLNKNDVYQNNELAFRTAERHLGIPALLDAEDMVEFPVPDRLSILTYLSQFYQVFAASQGTPTRIVPKRAAGAAGGIVSSASPSPAKKMAVRGGGIGRREPCRKCGMPVFLAERLHVDNQLYHRTCFRCARCKHQLNLDNYYETETEGQFCCETCPDEEIPNRENSDKPSITVCDAKVVKDDDKDDEYSADFETVLEANTSSTITSSARLEFMSSFVDLDDVPPELPKSEPPPPDDTGRSSSPVPVQNSNSEIVANITTDSAPISSDVSDEVNNVDAKDIINSVTSSSSLVKARLKLFEPSDVKPSEADDKVIDVPSSTDESKRSDLDVSVSEDVVVVDKEVNDEDLELSSNENNDCNITNASANAEEPIEVPSDAPEEVTEPSVITISSTESLDENVISMTECSSEVSKPTEDSIVVVLNSTESSDDNVVGVTECSTDVSKPIEDSIVVVLNSTESLDDNVIGVTECSTHLSKPIEDSIVVVLSTTISSNDDNVSLPLETVPPDDDYPESLNPFGDDEEVVEKPVPKKRIRPFSSDYKIEGKASTNPFGDSGDEEDSDPQPTPSARRVIAAPKISFNPFWIDGKEPEDDDEKPTPQPRSSTKNIGGTPETKPRVSNLSANSSGVYGSTSSISSVNSSVGLTPSRKKKPAPLPPTQYTAGLSSQTSSPPTSLQTPPARAKVKQRKNRKAPLPLTSTPIPNKEILDAEIPIGKSAKPDDKTEVSSPSNNVWEIEKTNKDERNRNRQSLEGDFNVKPVSEIMDKSTYGQWKRKKGPAPARPVPQRRIIKALPVEEVKRQLDVIELQMQGLERQGVRLEQIIRDRCENAQIDPDTSLTDTEVEDLVLQLFELVNEKNELFRKQAELMYLRRQQRLEEEHADLEYQIRCLMDQPELNKTDSDKSREEELIKRLVEVVEQRNEIIECLEMDRVRENQEDDSISSHLSLLALKREEDTVEKATAGVEKVEKKKKDKKDKKFKSKSKVDADKDIDESEYASSATDTMKKKKKKWFSK